jgi:LmbE family N-acetylglucosaminyl deacetylase
MFRLLVVTAHPDDESGGFGGTLALYAERGVQTHVLCLTAGAAARHRGPARSAEELKALRRDELAQACRVLKTTSCELLDYPDGSLPRADFYTAAGDVVRRIRRLRPHIVLTFGAEGAVTGHPDHAMAGLFASAAFQWAPRLDRFAQDFGGPWRPQKLYYGTVLFNLPDRPPIALPPVTAEIDVSPYVARKLQAFKSHLTQEPLFPIFEGSLAQQGGKECFHLAASTTPRKIEWESDLFAGVTEN